MGTRAEQLDEEWLASFNLTPQQADPGPVDSAAPERFPLGPVQVEPARFGGYLRHRVSITFTVPSGLEPGIYSVQVGDWENGEFLGDLIGAQVWVGQPPEFDRSYEWPLDEPLIAQLPDDAVLSGPGWEITAGEIRQGIYPPGAEGFLLDPANLPPNYQVKQPAVTATALSSTTTAVSPTTAVSETKEPPSLTTSAISPATATALEDHEAGVVEEESQGVLEPFALAVALLALIAAGVVGLRRRRRESFETVGEEEPLVRVGEHT